MLTAMHALALSAATVAISAMIGVMASRTGAACRVTDRVVEEQYRDGKCLVHPCNSWSLAGDCVGYDRNKCDAHEQVMACYVGYLRCGRCLIRSTGCEDTHAAARAAIDKAETAPITNWRMQSLCDSFPVYDWSMFLPTAASAFVVQLICWWLSLQKLSSCCRY
jgi:hypothetical protein